MLKFDLKYIRHLPDALHALASPAGQIAQDRQTFCLLMHTAPHGSASAACVTILFILWECIRPTCMQA